MATISVQELKIRLQAAWHCLTREFVLLDNVHDLYTDKCRGGATLEVIEGVTLLPNGGKWWPNEPVHKYWVELWRQPVKELPEGYVKVC